MKILITALLISCLVVGCKTQDPFLKMVSTPQEPILIPTLPDILPISGLIPLKSGQRVVFQDGKKHFTVPKKGGIYAPKQTMLDLDYNATSWALYGSTVEKIGEHYNKRVKEHNEFVKAVLAKKAEEEKKSWWSLW